MTRRKTLPDYDWDLSANLSLLWPEHPQLHDRVSAAARAGFGAVEIHFVHDIDLDSFEADLRRNELTLALFDPYPGRWHAGARGLLCLPDRHAELLASTHDALDTAERLGRPMLNVLLGRPPANLSHAAAVDLATDRLAELGLLAESRGIRLVIEALNSIDHPRYLVSDILEAARVVDDVNSPSVGLLFDTYHVAMGGDDPVSRIEDVAHAVFHIQIADAPERHQPGTGDLDFDGLFERLAGRGWQGLIGLEYAPQSTTAESFDWIDHPASAAGSNRSPR